MQQMIDNNFKGENGFTLQGGIKDASWVAMLYPMRPMRPIPADPRPPASWLPRHIRRLAEECSVPMPIIDIAHQHLIAARANGGDQLDWSSLVGGQRLSAGLPPFTKKVRAGAMRPESVASRADVVLDVPDPA